MRFSLRIFLGYFLLVIVLGAYLVSLIGDEIKPTVRQSAEEILAESANLLAEVIRDDFVAGTLDSGAFAAAISRFTLRQPKATIWGVRKDAVDLRVYVTDAAGIVKLDSTGEVVGQDYSQWRDVYLTLKGEYGARSSTIGIDGDPTTVMYVAAPIVSEGRTVGVLTVAKPNLSMQPYIERAYEKLTRATIILVGLGLVLGGFFSYWLSRGITQLTDFARRVADGGGGPPPALQGNRELGILSQAIGTMRDKLEGKSYVENYVHGLTHELKSPLAGIQSSAELLGDNLTESERARFVEHIQRETARMQTIVDRLLELAKLEQRRELQDPVPLPLASIVESVRSALGPQMDRRSIRPRIEIPPSATVLGERFLLEQAVRNLWQNALDHSPDGAAVTVEVDPTATGWRLTLHNQGDPIPEFALPRLFERFYSLPRGASGTKGSGLGLPLTESIAKLHGGTVSVGNHPVEGVVAYLDLPSASR
jgi:two-component system, OmpR family, sensor histidine kinase CreC